MAENKKRDPAVRSSAAEYLTFVASAGESDASFEIRYEDENIWLTLNNRNVPTALYTLDDKGKATKLKFTSDGE